MEPLRLIDHFKNDVASIQEDDYGDFMRRAGSYLANLEQVLSGSPPEVFELIDEMRTYLMYHPSWGIETTRARLLRDADALGTELRLLNRGELRLLKGGELPLPTRAGVAGEPVSAEDAPTAAPL